MPIRAADTNTVTQDCMGCGAGHGIPLWQGFSKSKKEPYALAEGDTLDVKTDAAASPVTVTFNTEDFADIAAALASEIATKITARLAGAVADVDSGAVRIVSDSTVIGVSRIEVTGGTAQAKLGFDGRACGPRMLGVTKGTGTNKQTAPDVIDFPHCPECGSKENMVRTWDVCPPEHAGTLHSMHRMCVNALAEHLKAQGNSDPDSLATHAVETAAPPDIDLNYPAGPITLSSMFAASDTESGGL